MKNDHTSCCLRSHPWDADARTKRRCRHRSSMTTTTTTTTSRTITATTTRRLVGFLWTVVVVATTTSTATTSWGTLGVAALEDAASLQQNQRRSYRLRPSPLEQPSNENDDASPLLRSEQKSNNQAPRDDPSRSSADAAASSPPKVPPREPPRGRWMNQIVYQLQPIWQFLEYSARTGLHHDVWDTLTFNLKPWNVALALALLAQVQQEQQQEYYFYHQPSSWQQQQQLPQYGDTSYYTHHHHHDPLSTTIPASTRHSRSAKNSGKSRRKTDPLCLVEAHRLMKFAMAAYQVDEPEEPEGNNDPFSYRLRFPSKRRRRRAATEEHSTKTAVLERRMAHALHVHDVHVMAVVPPSHQQQQYSPSSAKDEDFNAAHDHVRHFCAVDHVHRQVVWAIRGTSNASEMMANLAAFSRPFVGGGVAHAAMAQLARAAWQQAAPHIQNRLDKNPGYELVLTGHSLGGGVACLLNLLLHHDSTTKRSTTPATAASASDSGNNNNNKPAVEIVLPSYTPIRCIVFACPPVYAPADHPLRGRPWSWEEDALGRCVHYLYGRDLIPFLSLHATRQVMAQIRVLVPWLDTLSWEDRMDGLLPWWDNDDQDHHLYDHDTTTAAERAAQANSTTARDSTAAPLSSVPWGSIGRALLRSHFRRHSTRTGTPRRIREAVTHAAQTCLPLPRSAPLYVPAGTHVWVDPPPPHRRRHPSYDNEEGEGEGGGSDAAQRRRRRSMWSKPPHSTTILAGPMALAGTAGVCGGFPIHRRMVNDHHPLVYQQVLADLARHSKSKK